MNQHDVYLPALAQLASFKEQIFHLIEKLSLPLHQLEADHIALRCHQLETAEYWLSQLQNIGRCISNQEINGRPIYVFLLHKPLNMGLWLISCVELPFPGKKQYKNEGWEHIEFVVNGAPEEFHDIVARFLPEKEQLTAMGLTFKSSVINAEREKLVNPTVAVSDGNITLKFHPYSLQQVIDSASH